MADSLDARAFTFGTHVFLGTGSSSEDLRLMAHELTHVVQQQPSLRRGDSSHAPGLTISRSEHAIMRMDWSGDMSHGRMPPCGAPSYAALPRDTAELGMVSSPARRNCMYTPLFHIPEVGFPEGEYRVTIRARVPNPRMECRDRDWSINAYECFSNGTNHAPGCDRDIGGYHSGGPIHSPLEVTYPVRGGSTRNLSVRVSNGCSEFPIAPRLEFVYPRVPEATAWEQFSAGIHDILSLLGLTEPFGVVFDGADALIYAAEGNWPEFVLSASASIPVAGAGIIALRRMRRGGADVIGMTIPREALRTLRGEDIVAALRRAEQDPRRAVPGHATSRSRAREATVEGAPAPTRRTRATTRDHATRAEPEVRIPAATTRSSRGATRHTETLERYVQGMRDENIVSRGLFVVQHNAAAVMYRDLDGSLQIVGSYSTESGLPGHAERRAIGAVRRRLGSEFNDRSIVAVFTELEPCRDGCEPFLRRFAPHAEVDWRWDLSESRERIRRLLEYEREVRSYYDLYGELPPPMENPF